MRIRFLAALFAFAFATTLRSAEANQTQRPNILWIIVEDMSAHFGCYNERSISTPNVDQLASQGTRFSKAFVTGPICSISRSALITGMYQTSIGAHHHRSGRGTVKIRLPEGVEPLPVLFHRAGYWTCNGAWPAKAKGTGKTDYNFEFDPKMYDGGDWSGRKSGQPFFAQIQLHGGKVRDGKNAAAVFERELGSLTKPDDLPLPPYYPRTPEILADWALTLDACRLVDKQVGEILDRLKQQGLEGSTIVFFLTDHGVSHARGKQFLYDEGTHVPLIVRGPAVPVGKVRTDLVEHIDVANMSLTLAGIPVPRNIQGRNVLAEDYVQRDAAFAARDRADETVDHIRSVRTERWKYIRNFLPQRPHLQPNNYKDHKNCLVALRSAQKAGLLDEVQQQLFAPSRPAEELYDLTADPWEIKNLALDKEHSQTLASLREKLERWMEQTNDRGRQPEPQDQYESDMNAYLGGKANARNPEIEQNIELMKRWAAEGK